MCRGHNFYIVPPGTLPSYCNETVAQENNLRTGYLPMAGGYVCALFGFFSGNRWRNLPGGRRTVYENFFGARRRSSGNRYILATAVTQPTRLQQNQSNLPDVGRPGPKHKLLSMPRNRHDTLPTMSRFKMKRRGPRSPGNRG